MSRGQIPSRIRRELEEIAPGWVISLTRGNHIRLTHPAGPVVVTALTPSDHRSRKNLRSMIRRYERQL